MMVLKLKQAFFLEGQEDFQRVRVGVCLSHFFKGFPLSNNVYSGHAKDANPRHLPDAPQET